MLDLIIKGIASLFLFAGAFFFITATIGLLRLPDIFTRLHATGKGDTLGAGLILIGLAILSGFSTTSVKLIVMLTFIFMTSPVATHTICRAVYDLGVRPWTKEVNK